MSSRRYCCRSTISLTQRLPFSGGRRPATDFGTPIDRIFISAQPITDLASGGSSLTCSCSTCCWLDRRPPRWPPVRRASMRRCWRSEPSWLRSCLPDFRGRGAIDRTFPGRDLRNSVLQHRYDQASLLAVARLPRRGEPAARCVQRRLARTRRDNTGHANVDGLLFEGEQDFVEPFSRPHPGEDDIDIDARLQAGKPDHALGELDDLDRLPHVEHVDRNVRMLRRQRVRGGGEYQIAGFANRHEIPDHVG